MNGFCYVYILESLHSDGGFYVGMTDDLAGRLVEHNGGRVPHTARLRPWRVKTAIAMRGREKAAALERYLKSGSGRAFTIRHL
jgi:putative endonuclease